MGKESRVVPSLGYGRWIEFFEGSENRLSIARLLQFLAYPPATGVLIWIHTTEAMSLYLSAFVLNGLAGKAMDLTAKVKGSRDATARNKHI